MKKIFEVNTNDEDVIAGINSLVSECNNPDGDFLSGIEEAMKAFFDNDMDFIMKWYIDTIDFGWDKIGYDFVKAHDIEHKLVVLYSKILDDENAYLENKSKRKKVNYTDALNILYDFDKLSRRFRELQSYPRDMEIHIQWLIAIYNNGTMESKNPEAIKFYKEINRILSYYHCIYYKSKEERKKERKENAEKILNDLIGDIDLIDLFEDSE